MKVNKYVILTINFFGKTSINIFLLICLYDD
jgi:hypothetical protein